MEFDVLLSREGAMLAAGIFGVTYSVRRALAKAFGPAALRSVAVKLISTLLPLALGPSLGLALLHRIEAWQERVLMGLVAATIVMVGRNLFKLSGQAISETE